MSEYRFVKAIRRSQISTLKFLLKINRHLIYTSRFSCGKSCLHICLEKDHVKDRDCECFELLVNHGADINRRYDSRHDAHHSWTPMMFAVHVKCLRCLKFLIEKGADLSIETSLGATALTLAIKERQFTIVETLVQHSSPALINHKDGEGKTALMWAAKCYEDQALSVCQQLIEAGADVNMTNRDGETALILASKACRGKCADVLIQYSTPELINHRDKGGRTALMWAAKSRTRDAFSLIQKFIEAGADVNILDNNRQTPLMLAAVCYEKEAPSLFQKLIAAGVDANIKDKDGNTALIHAVQHCNITLAEYVVQVSIPEVVNCSGTFGKTALLWAAKCPLHSTPSLIQKLIEARADVNITDAKGNTALIRAVIFAATSKNVQNAYVLIQHSTPRLINHKNNFEKTALMLAADCHGRETPSLIQKLIEAGADVNISDTDGETALIRAVIHAVTKKEVRNADVLIQHSTPALINHRDNDGKTALMRAAECYGRDVSSLFQKLVKAEADVNIPDKDGQTALMWATECHGGDPPSLFQKLIEAGADVNITDKDGSTALILAVKHAVTKEEVRNADFLIQLSTAKLINHRDNDGRTALMFVVDNFRTDFFLCQQLIKAGADLNIADNYGTTILIQAVKECNDECAKLLIPLSTLTLINKQDNGGRTALMWAILYIQNFDYHIDIARYGWQRHYGYDNGIERHQWPSWRVSLCEHLIEAGADVNLKDNDGETALSFALEMENEKVVSLLLEKEAFVDNISISGKTLLYQACKMKYWSRINQLLIKGADPTLSFRHEGFIHHSIINYQKATLRTLVLNGFPPQDCAISRDRFLYYIYHLPHSVSPLSLSLWENQPTMARYLIRNKFFTRSDINQTLDQNTELRQRLTEFEANECLQILDVHLQTVQTLSTLCLVTITSALTQDFREDNGVRGTSSANWTFTPTFKERVESLGLPPILQRALLHQTPSSRICCKEWENISLEEERHISDCNECDYCTGSSDLDEFFFSESYLPVSPEYHEDSS